MIDLRDSPAALRPPRIGPCTLVAMTTSSRLAKSARARPTIASLVPSEYTFAVSKKLIPASSASWMNPRLVSSASVHAWLPVPESPKLMHPRQILDTSSPVGPSFVYFIVCSPFDRRCADSTRPQQTRRRSGSGGEGVDAEVGEHRASVATERQWVTAVAAGARRYGGKWTPGCSAIGRGRGDPGGHAGQGHVGQPSPGGCQQLDDRGCRRQP